MIFLTIYQIMWYFLISLEDVIQIFAVSALQVHNIKNVQSVDHV